MMEYSSVGPTECPSTPTRHVKTLSYSSGALSNSKRKTRSKSRQDRFVPCRIEQNQEYSTHELGKSVSKKETPTTYSHQNNNFKNCLLEKTNTLPIQRVLVFNTPTRAQHSNNYWKDYSIKYNSQFAETKRKIPDTATQVLNAPDVIDDFYLNLLHWGNTGSVAVALGYSLYILQPMSLHTTLLSTSSDGSFPSAVQWDPSGHSLAVGTSRGTVQLWDPETLKFKYSISSSIQTRVGCISWHPNDTNLMTVGYRSGEVQIYDLRSYQPRPLTQFKAHSMDVCGLQWSPNGQYLASGGNDNYVHIWNSYSSGPWAKPFLTYKEHSAAVKALSWCPWQSNTIATGGGTADKTLHIWNALTGLTTRSIKTNSQISGIVWSFEYKEILTSHGYNENCLAIWDPETLQVPLATLYGHKQRILQLAISPDGQEVASLSADETLRIWECFTSTKKSRSQSKKSLRYGGAAAPPCSSTLDQDLLMYGL